MVGAANIELRGQASNRPSTSAASNECEFRYHVDAEPRDGRHHVHPGAVAHRRGVQQRIAWRNRIDFGGISLARGGEHLMAEHGALGPAGRPGGVEQPGEIVASARPDAHRIGGEQGLVGGAADCDQALEARRRVGRDLGIEPVRSEADAGAGVLEDVAKFAAVQFGVGRHRGQAGMPDAEHQLDIVRTILRGDGDPLAGRKPEALPQRSREPCRAAGDVAIISDDAGAEAERRPIAVAQSRAFEPERQVHGNLPPPSYAAAALPFGCTSAV